VFDFLPKYAKNAFQRIGLVLVFSIAQYFLYGLVYDIVRYVAPGRDISWPQYIVSFPGSIYDYFVQRGRLPDLSEGPFYLSMILWGTLWSFVLTRALTRRRPSQTLHDTKGLGKTQI